MGSPILRSGASAVVASASGTSLTANHPSGSLPGDLILIWATSPDNGISWSVPNFNSFTPAPGAGLSAQLLWKIDSGAEPSTYTVTSSGTTNAGLVICAYGNVDQVILFDPSGYSGQVNSISSTISASSITTLYWNSQLLWFGSVVKPSGAGTPTITAPGGYSTEVAQSTGTASGNNVGVFMADAVSSGPGATGNVNGTSSSNQFNAALLLGLAVANPVSWAAFRARPVSRQFATRLLRRGAQFFFPAGQGTLPEGRIAARQVFRSRRPPQWPKSITRTRLSQPPWGQANQGQSFPVFLRRSSAWRPAYPYIRRGRFFTPVPPQGAQSTPFPLFTGRQVRRLPGTLYLRRGRVFFPTQPQAAQGFPFGLSYQPQRLRHILQAGKRSMRLRLAAPVPPQATQGTPFPLWTRQAAAPPLRRFAAPRRRLRIFQVPVPRITWQASAALTGTGTLTAAALVTEVTSAALSGTGMMTVVAVRTTLASAALSGTGTLTARGLVTEAASVSLSGTGTLSATAAIVKLAAASLSATGTLTATGTDSPAARLSGTGTLSVTAVMVTQASASLSGTGTLTASATTAQPNQRITITGNAQAAWETIAENRLMEIREPHVAESYVVTQDLEDGTYDP